MSNPAYQATADALVERIVALGDGILAANDPFELFSMGLDCSDLSPSLAQAGWALAQAKRRLRAESCESPSA